MGYEDLKKINPRIIYSCTRGFGESGPYKDYGSTAHTNNSMTDWTHTGWGYSKAPGTKAIGIGDEAAGVSMVCGILAALHARERTGEGQRISVSMQLILDGIQSGPNGIDYAKAKEILDFLSPSSPHYPDYYGSSKHVIDGAQSLFDLKNLTIESHYGYYADKWVMLKLRNYVP